MKVKNLLFDMDGTLVDSLPGIEYASEEAIRAIFPGRTIPSLRAYIGPPIREVFRQTVKEATAEQIDIMERQFRIIYDSQGWKKSILYDVAETMAQLTEVGFLNFVATNKPNAPTLNILDSLGILCYLQGTVSPDIKEPAFGSKAEMMKYLLVQHKLDPRATIYVGDSKEDWIAAQECGLKFIAVFYGYGGEFYCGSSDIDAHIGRFEDLLTIISN